MKIRRTIGAMAIVGMMIATVFVMAADKPKEISNTRSASCILRITYDPSVLPLNLDMLDYLMTSSGILGKVNKEILKTECDTDIDLTEIGDGDAVEPLGGFGGGMGEGMMGGMGMGPGMMDGMEMGGGMGMGGFEGGGMFGMAGGGGDGAYVPMPPDVPDMMAPFTVPSESGQGVAGASKGVAGASSNAPTQNSPDALRQQAEQQMRDARQRARQAELRTLQAQRRAEQIQAQMARSSGYGRLNQIDLNVGQVGSTRILLVRFAIGVIPDDSVMAATEAMEAMINLLRGALQRDFDAFKERMTVRADLAQKQAAEAEAMVRTLQNELRALSPSKELNRNRLMDEISKYQDQIRKFDMEEELNRVMLDSLKKEIDETRKKAEVQISEDPVLKDLEVMLEISKERVDTAKQLIATGRAGQDALQDAMEKVTLANIELAKRKEEIGASAAAVRVDDLFKRIDDIALRTTQNEIQVKRLQGQIRESEQYLDRSVNYEMLVLRLDLAKEKLGNALRRADTLRDFRPEPPVVETIGAD